MNTATYDAPSLRRGPESRSTGSDEALSAHSLLDLMYDGFYALFMLKNGVAPLDGTRFRAEIRQFLDDVERNARRLSIGPDDTYAAKYAFCTVLDEIILQSSFAFREEWSVEPLQLTLFGDQLGGAQFFVKLEELSQKGAAHIQALEVFHICLLLGFKGRYIMEAPETINYLTAKIGREIASLKRHSASFAPHWARPDVIINRLRSEVPLWAVAALFALIGLGGYLGVNWSLSKSTRNQLAGYSDLVKLAPRVAHLTITLP